MNHAFQLVVEAHDLDPREGVLLEELCCGRDQLSDVVAVDERGPNVHGPIATCVSQSTPHLVLQ